MRLDRYLQFLRPMLYITASFFAAPALLALPEDAKQPFEISALKFDGDLNKDKNWVVYKGTQNEPAKISQGTLVITGTEIRIFLENNEPQTVIAIGDSAHFQQQPARDQELVKANGKQIKFEKKSRLLTIDTNAELNQSGKVTLADHIEYNVDTQHIGGEQVQMTFPLGKGKQ